MTIQEKAKQLERIAIELRELWLDEADVNLSSKLYSAKSYCIEMAKIYQDEVDKTLDSILKELER